MGAAAADPGEDVRGSIGIEAGRMGGIITPDAHRSLYLMEAKRLLSAPLGALPSRALFLSFSLSLSPPLPLSYSFFLSAHPRSCYCLDFACLEFRKTRRLIRNAKDLARTVRDRGAGCSGVERARPCRKFDKSFYQQLHGENVFVKVIMQF